MLATIPDDTWNMLNIQHIIPNSKRWIMQSSPVVAIHCLKDSPTWLKVATTLEKAPNPCPHDSYRFLKFIKFLRSHIFNTQNEKKNQFDGSLKGDISHTSIITSGCIQCYVMRQMSCIQYRNIHCHYSDVTWVPWHLKSLAIQSQQGAN